MSALLLYYNKLLDATLSSSATASGYILQSILDQRPYKYWKANAAGTNYIAAHFGSAQLITGIGISGHNLSSTGSTIYIEHSSDGSSWTTDTSLAPSSDDTFMLSFTGTTEAYWRIRIVNSSGSPMIAVLYFGTPFQFPYPPDAQLTPFSEAIISDFEESKEGQPLGAVVKNSKVDITHTYSNFLRSWYDSTYYPFWRDHGKLLKCFFYAWDINTCTADVFYVRFKKDFVNSPLVSNLSNYDQITLDLLGNR